MINNFALFRSLKLALALVLVSGLMACGGGGGGDDEIQLPKGVTITSEPVAGSYEEADQQIDPYNYVRITLVFKNSTDKNETVTLPACFTFVDPTASNQDGLSIWRREVVIPANSTYVLKLGTYCMNSDRPAPSGGVVYELGGKADSKALQKVCDILKNRVIDRNSSVQSIVWKLTSGGELDEDDYKVLNAIAESKSLPRSSDGFANKADLLKHWLGLSE